MADVKVQKDFLFLKETSEALGDITGIIPINSKKEIGSFSITFSEDVFTKVMTSMLGEEVTQIDDENKDGVVELCNQNFGNAKAVLNKQDIFLDMTIPTVVCGHGHTISHAASGNVVGVYFNTEYGTFVIECIVSNK
jgi:chemotaxis protein CheX